MSTLSDSTAPFGIKAPYPLKLTIDDLLQDRNNKRIPNAFIVYRKSLQRELVSFGYKFSVPRLSTMASNAWNNESEEVKQAYINLVKDAKACLKDEQVVENDSNGADPNTYSENSSSSDSFNNFYPYNSSLDDRVRVLEDNLNLLTGLVGLGLGLQF